MATKLNIPKKQEGSTLSAIEFNAVVTSINENADSLQEAYTSLQNKLGVTTINIDQNKSFVIDSIEKLIQYINEYGLSTPTYNTPPIIKISNTTIVYKVGEKLTLDIELYDLEGGYLSLRGINPTISGGYSTFIIENLRSGINTIDLNQLVYQNSESSLPVGLYNFTEIYVVDSMGRSSSSPVQLKIIVGTISLSSLFDSTVSYKTNQAISVRFGVSSITNDLSIQYRLYGKMLIDDETSGFIYQNYPEIKQIDEAFKVVPNDPDFITGQVYYHNYVLPDTFTNIGDYILEITASGLGVTSNTISVNIVVNREGVLYTSSTFDVNGDYYAGDSIVIPSNIFYTQTEGVDYTYQCFAYIDGINIEGSSDIVSIQKNISLKLTLPDDPDLYTIKYYSRIITPQNEVYKTNTNYIAVQAKSKSEYSVLTDSSSKIELYLTAKGKSNSSPNWKIWENRYNLDQKYFGTLYNFSTVVNGWEEISGNNQYTGDTLNASGDAYCVINYSPFKNFDVNKTGLTIDFAIKHGQLISEENYNLSIGKPGSYPLKGLYVKNSTLKIYGLNSNIDIPLICDNKVLTKFGEWEKGDEYAYVTVTLNYETKEVFVYMNGIISSWSSFSDPAALTHDNPIIFNAALDANDNIFGVADSKMRYMRVYHSCLTDEQVLSNYIAYYPNDNERKLMEELNNTVNPILSYGYLKGDRSVLDKDVLTRLFFNFTPGNEKVVASTYIPDPLADGVYGQSYMDMKEEMPVDVDLQGNSSLSYPIKNYDVVFYDAEAWNNSKVTNSKKYQMVVNYDKIAPYRPWNSQDEYHLKANYIDSSQSNNLIIAKLSDKIFRLPYQPSNWAGVFSQGNYPFKNYTVTRLDGTVDAYSRWILYPQRISVDGYPILLKGDYIDSNQKKYEKEFIGVYTWNLRQHRDLYSMTKPSLNPNARHVFYRSESNGDSVHEQLRSGFCKFIDMSKQPLYLDSYGRSLTLSYIASQEENAMFKKHIYSDYRWHQLNSSSGYLQPNNQYTWIKFSNDSKGSQMNDNQSGMTYIGVAINKTSDIKSNKATDYYWTPIDIYTGILDSNNKYTLIQYSSNPDVLNMSGSISSMQYIGFIYNETKIKWVEGVDYFDKTGDPTEMQWRIGAELLMDFECREPSDMGLGHWEKLVGNNWVKTLDIVDPADLSTSSTERYTLRFVWDQINVTGDAKRTGHDDISYYLYLLDQKIKIPTLADPSQTFSGINKNLAIQATEQHVDFINAIKWYYNSSDECFSNPLIFEKYFDLRSCLDYVLTCLTFCLTDSIGRNLTMLAWDETTKIDSGIMDRKRMRFVPAFYDIDTAFGTNVQGGLYSTPYVKWPYDIGTQYIAEEGSGQEYNCFGSLLMKRISKLYAPALMKRYSELRSGVVDPNDSKTNITAPYDYLSILQLYTKQIVGRIGERYFNKDARFKYIGFDNDPQATAKRNYITNARGNKVMFMKSFLKKRMDYIDSILGYIPDTEDMAYIQHYSSGQMTLTFETAVAGYVRVSFAQNQATSVFCDGINPVSLSYNYSTVTQHILRIYNCGIITKMSGLTNKDIRIARLNSMTSLKYLDLKGNPNFGTEVSTLEISECKSLIGIDLSNCNGPYIFTPDLSGCVLLEEFLVGNSSIGNCSFTNNLKLKKIDMSNCKNFIILDVSNLYKLSDLIYDDDKLISLNIGYSSIVIDFSKDNSYDNLLSLSIINNTNITNLIFGQNSFNNLTQLSISGCPKLISVVGLFKNRINQPALNTNFLGDCPKLINVDNVFENSALKTIPTRFLYNSPLVKTMIGCFKNCKNLISIPSRVLDELLNIEDITDIFNGAKLQVYSDITEVDENENIVIIGKKIDNVFQNENIFSNCPKLKIVTNAFANSELINIPRNIFSLSPLITNIDYCFSGIQNDLSIYNGQKKDLLFPSLLWRSSANISSAKGVFKNTYIKNIDTLFLSDFPKLYNASELFYNSNLTDISSQIFSNSPLINDLSYSFAANGFSLIPDNFLNNFTLLSNINNIFYNSSIKILPKGFLVNNKIESFKFSDLGIPLLHTVNYDILSQNTVISNISNLFSNTKIQITPNNLLSNNQTINNMNGFLENSIVQQIGDNFLYTNSVTTTESMFSNRTDLTLSLGSGFMKNSLELVYADYMFEGCTTFVSIPEDMMNNCPKLISSINMFNNALNLNIINTGFFQNVPMLSLITNMFKNTQISSIPINSIVNPLITKFKFSDILTRNISIATTFLQDSPLNNIDNLFSNTLIDTIPDGFFNTHEILNPQLMFNQSSVNVIGSNTFAKFRVENATDLFYGGSIVEIGDDFMVGSGVKIIDDIFSDTNLINKIGNNFLGNKSNLISAISAFKNSGISQIGTGFINDAPLLTNIDNIFNGCEDLSYIPIGFLNNCPLVKNINGLLIGNKITQVPSGFLFGNTGMNSFKFSDFCDFDFIIQQDFLYGCTGIINIDNLFENSLITNIPDDFFNNHDIVEPLNIFYNSKIKTIGNNVLSGIKINNSSTLFVNCPIETIGNDFIKNSDVLIMDDMFVDNKTIKSIGNNFLGSKENVISANSMFKNSTIQTIGLGMLNNSKLLINIINIFNGCLLLNSLPIDFIKNSPLVNSLTGVFTNNNIIEIPNDFCLGNTGITDLTDVFNNSNIINIGNGFMTSSIGLTSIDNMLLSNTTVKTIGNDFLSNSAVKTAIGAFKLSKLESIGSGIFVGSPLENISSLLEGSAIKTIGANFIVSFDKLTNITNIFKSTGLLQIPTDFLKSCLNVNSLTGVFSNNLITTIPDNFCAGNKGIASLTGVFDGTNITTIGSGFMNHASIKSIDSVFLNNKKITTIGNDFLKDSLITSAANLFMNSTLGTIGTGAFDNTSIVNCSHMFDGSLISTIGTGFLSNKPELTDITNIFLNTTLTSLPINFIVNSPKVNSLVGLLVNNNITIIPTGFLSGNTGLTAFRFSTFTNKDFVIPADFLQGCLGTVSINNLFTDSPITVIPDNFFHTLVSVNPTDMFLNSVVRTIGNNCFDAVQMNNASYMFSETTHGAVQTIGNNFMVNSNVSNLKAMFERNSTIISIGDNFIGDGNNAVDASYMFHECINLLTVGTILFNAGKLETAKYIFNLDYRLKTMPVNLFKESKKLSNLDSAFANCYVNVPDNFMPNNTLLTSLTGMFDDFRCSAIGNNFMNSSTGLINIDSLFAGKTYLKSIGNNFMSGGAITSANGLFQNCTSILSVGDNCLSGNPLTSANHFFDGAIALTTIGLNFFNNFSNLVYIIYFFNNTTIPVLPVGFLSSCYKVNSLEGVFTNNLITEIPDEFLVGNTGITSLIYLLNSVSTSIFANTKIEKIGDMFMYGSTGLTSLDYVFSGNTVLSLIGNLFLAKSAVTTSNYAFYNATNLWNIGSGLLNGCLLTSMNSLFEGSINLEKIGDYFEWFETEDVCKYWYQLEDDSCKCNVAGQQAEVGINVSVPYLESEYNSLEYVSDIVNSINVFKGTKLVRTPKGFLSKCLVSSSPVLVNILSGSNIKFFNPDLFDATLITDVKSMFNGTTITAVPIGFMEKNIVNTSKTINWSTFVNNVNYLPKTFLKNCYFTSWNNFIQSNLRIIQNDWLSWQWYSANNWTLSIYGSNLVNFPRNFSYKNTYFAMDRTFCVGIVGYWQVNRYMETIIPEGFLYHITNTTQDGYSNQFSDNIFKGCIPKTFLCNLSGKINKMYSLFIKQSYILSVEKGFLSQSYNPSTNNYIELANFFSGCTNLKYVADNIFQNVDLTTSNSLTLYGIFYNCPVLTKIPSSFSRFGKLVIETASMFYGCTSITNSNNQLDSFLINCCYNNANLIKCAEMFRSSGLIRLPDQAFVGCTGIYQVNDMFNGSKLISISDDAFSDCKNMTVCYSLFRETPITKIPTNLLSTGTLNNCSCDSLFYNCVNLVGSIPTDFFKLVKVSNFQNTFWNCSKLSGKIPSNFAIGGSGIITTFQTTFGNCTNLSGFVDNIWNFSDFSKVTNMFGMFQNSKIDQIPSCFCTGTFSLLTSIGDMFSGCSSLQNIPDNFLQYHGTTFSADNCFKNCSSLISIGNKFLGNPSKVTAVRNAFQGCSSLISIPNNFLSDVPNLTGITYIFNNCTSLGSIGINFLNNAPLIVDAGYTFSNCSNLVSIGTGFISNSPLLTSVYQSFNGCAKLTGILDSSFLNKSTLINSCCDTFNSCKIISFEANSIFERLTNGNSCNFLRFMYNNTSYTGALPSLWTLYPSNTAHSYCFRTCINASNWTSVPSGWR